MPFYIYSLQHKTLSELGQYIGSTSNFELRRNNHKCFYYKNRHYNPVYSVMKENGGWDDWEMRIITTTDTKENMIRIENALIMNSNNILNKRIAYVENYPEYKRQAAKTHYYKYLDENKKKARERYHKKKHHNNIDDCRTIKITGKGETI